MISLLVPLISIRVIDSLRMYNDPANRNIVLFMLAWILASGLVAVLEYVQNDRFRRYGDHVASQIFQQKFNYRLSQGFLEWNSTDAKKTTEMVKKDIEDIYPLLCGLPFIMIRHGLIGLTGIIIIVFINIKLALAVAILMPLYLLAYLIQSESIRKAYWQTRVSSRNLWQKMVEYLQSVPLLTYSGMTGTALKKTGIYFREYISDEFKLFGSIQKRRIYVRIIASISPVYLAFIAFVFLNYDLASPGEIFGFWGLFNLVINAVTGFTSEYTGILKSLAVFAQLKESADTYPESKVLISMSQPIGHIECRNPCLEYKGNGNQRLNFPSFHIKSGDVVTLVGRSGSGKSTLLRLMIGLIRPDSGEILVNGIKREFIENNSFFARIGYVEQDGYIYSENVRSNILIGRPYDQRKWRYVVDCTGLQKVLTRTKQGDTGENGACLSGGEKQRILIARALYDRPSWLFLDEPFRGIDDKTKNDIETLIQNLNDHVTIILVTHTKNHTFSATKCIFLE